MNHQDSYFIRLKDNENYYLHFEGDNKDDDSEVVYKVNKGVVGAAIWNFENGSNFIKKFNPSNMELIKVSEVFKQ